MLVAHLTCVCGGDTKTNLNIFPEILNDLSNTASLKNISNFVPYLFYSLKNLIQDRYSAKNF